MSADAPVAVPGHPVPAGGAVSALEAEAVELIRALLRIDSVNTGDAATIGDGETRAALFVKEQLEQGAFTRPHSDSLAFRQTDRVAGALAGALAEALRARAAAAGVVGAAAAAVPAVQWA